VRHHHSTFGIQCWTLNFDMHSHAGALERKTLNPGAFYFCGFTALDILTLLLIMLKF